MVTKIVNGEPVWFDTEADYQSYLNISQGAPTGTPPTTGGTLSPTPPTGGLRPQTTTQTQSTQSVPSWYVPQIKAKGITIKSKEGVESGYSQELKHKGNLLDQKLEYETNLLTLKDMLQRDKNKKFLDSYFFMGKPLKAFTDKDYMELAGGDVKTATSLVKFKNAFENNDKKTLLQSAVGVLNHVIPLADAIPTAEGIEGVTTQPVINYFSTLLGQLPEKRNYDRYIRFALPLMTRGLGDVGNISDTAIALMEDSLSGLDSAQAKDRMIARKTLSKILSDLTGEVVKLEGKSKTSDNDLDSMSTDQIKSMIQQLEGK